MYKNIKNRVIFTWVQIKMAKTHENVYTRVLINFLQRLPEQRMYTQPSGLMQALKYWSVTDIVRPIREIVRRGEETTGHSVQTKVKLRFIVCPTRVN